MKHGSLFTGLEGFGLAAEWMGWENIFQVENNEWCINQLIKNFPKVKRYKDVREFDGTKYAGQIDILTGGFPCQSFSIAGKGALDLTLWKEMYRIINEIKPPFIVAENVPGIVSRKRGLAFHSVCADLEASRYEVIPLNIPAAGKGAPHERERIWFVAYSDSARRERNRIKQGEDEIRPVYPGCGNDRAFSESQVNNSNPADPQSAEQERAWYSWAGRTGFTDCYTPNWSRDWTEVASELCGVDDGLPKELDRGQRIEAGGNAIVPQVAFEIFKAIESTLNPAA